MRLVVGLILFVAVATAAGVYAQDEELGLLGRYDDVRRIPFNYTKNTNEFVFTRLIYNGQIPGYYKNWYTDYPRADRNLILALKRLTNLPIANGERAIPINDPDLFNYPLVYSSEVEQMVLTKEDADIMREYLARGGFWMIDDFWGSFEFDAFAENMRKIIPGVQIKDIPLDHPMFHMFFDINQLIQTPSTAYLFNGHITWETDGFKAECKGVWDDHGRLIVVINHNTDLGDAYENADVAGYPVAFTTYGYRIALNTFLYALSH